MHYHHMAVAREETAAAEVEAWVERVEGWAKHSAVAVGGWAAVVVVVEAWVEAAVGLATVVVG